MGGSIRTLISLFSERKSNRIKQVVKSLSLIRIWINLLTELKLLLVNHLGEYVITGKGKEYPQTYNPHW